MAPKCAEIFEVEKILGRRTRKGKPEYMIRWRGYGKQNDTWEPEANLRLCWEAVNNYNRLHGHTPMKKPSPRSIKIMKEQKIISGPLKKSRKKITMPTSSKKSTTSKTQAQADRAKKLKKQAVARKTSPKTPALKTKTTTTKAAITTPKVKKTKTSKKDDVIVIDSDHEDEDTPRYKLSKEVLDSMNKAEKSLKRKAPVQKTSTKAKKAKVKEETSATSSTDSSPEVKPVFSTPTKFIKSESKMEVKSLSPSDSHCQPGCELNVRKYKVMPQSQGLRSVREYSGYPSDKGADYPPATPPLSERKPLQIPSPLEYTSYKTPRNAPRVTRAFARGGNDTSSRGTPSPLPGTSSTGSSLSASQFAPFPRPGSVHYYPPVSPPAPLHPPNPAPLHAPNPASHRLTLSPPPESYQSMVHGLPQKLMADRYSADGEEKTATRRVSVRQSECSFRYRNIVVKKYLSHTQIWLFTNTKLRNALNPQVFQELIAALHNAKYDNSRLVMLSGTGSVFCSGVDLMYLAGPDRRTAVSDMTTAVREFLHALIAFPKPIVAAVNGPAIGLGASMLPLCDVVYASDKATFYMPYSRLAQTPEGCSSYTFANIMGHAMASEMLLGGRKLTAMEAYQNNLVSQVFWPTSMMQDVIPRVEYMASQSARALEASKLMMRGHHKAKLQYTCDSECTMLTDCWLGQEFHLEVQRYIEQEEDLLQ